MLPNNILSIFTYPWACRAVRAAAAYSTVVNTAARAGGTRAGVGMPRIGTDSHRIRQRQQQLRNPAAQDRIRLPGEGLHHRTLLLFKCINFNI